MRWALLPASPRTIPKLQALGKGGGQSWCKAKGTKGCCTPRLIPKVDILKQIMEEKALALRTLRPPSGPVSPPGSVSLCVHKPLGTMCDQANKNQGVSPASQAPLWDQQTECHSNQW